MEIGIFFFSPTGNTHTIVGEIKHYLDFNQINYKIWDLTKPEIRNALRGSLDVDYFIFGFPIYYWRAPSITREWLKTLDGKGRKCAVFFTYGGINEGIARYDVAQILKDKRFVLVAAAEFIGKHSFNLAGWDVLADRPNEQDKTVAREFIKNIIEKFKDDASITLQFEKPNVSEDFVNKMAKTNKGAIPIPDILIESCTSCEICESNCPTQAISISEKKINRKNCIRCFRCITICPENAIMIKDMSTRYQFIKNRLKLSKKLLNSKKSKIYL